MIKGLTSLIVKGISTPALNAAIRQGDDAVTQKIVHNLLNSPEFLFDEYVRGNLLDQVIHSAPQCTAESIRRGLRAAIADVPINPHMLRAILPYADSSDRHYGLRLACERDCEVAIDMLYPLCDIPRVVDELNHTPYQPERCVFWATTFQQRMDDEKLRETLTAQLPSLPETPQRKM